MQEGCGAAETSLITEVEWLVILRDQQPLGAACSGHLGAHGAADQA